MLPVLLSLRTLLNLGFQESCVRNWSQRLNIRIKDAPCTPICKDSGALSQEPRAETIIYIDYHLTQGHFQVAKKYLPPTFLQFLYSLVQSWLPQSESWMFFSLYL